MCNPAETVQLVHKKIYELDSVFMTIPQGQESIFKTWLFSEVEMNCTIKMRWCYVNIGGVVFKITCQ